MTDADIENEVQARIEFKMNEFMVGMKNVCRHHWSHAFSTMDQKYQHYWEAFEQMQEMFQKEVRMAPPHDDMAKRRKWEAKEKAVQNITDILDIRGRRDYHHKIRIVVKEIENAQNF